MKISPVPFFISAGFSTLYQLLLVGLTAALTFLAIPAFLSGDFTNSSDITPLFMAFLVYACLGLILTGLGYVLAGVIYAFFQQRSGHPDPGECAFGGAASAIVANVIGAVLSTASMLLISKSALTTLLGTSPGTVYPYNPTSGLLSAISSIPSFCVGIVIAGAVGAGAGALMGWIFQARQRRQDPYSV